MKKFPFLLLFVCFSTYLFAQDIIITKENERIEAKILFEYDAVIKYALFNDPEGTALLIAKSKIKTITYENGDVVSFEHITTNTAKSNVISNNNVNENEIVRASTEKIFKNVIRFKPLVTIMGIFVGGFDMELQYARYLTKALAIPVDVEIGYLAGISAFALMTGIEGVPLQHRQKSGLFLNALAGFIVLNAPPYQAIGFLANPNVGYQLMTKKGFVFNAAIGPEYNGITKKFRARITLDFGFAF